MANESIRGLAGARAFLSRLARDTRGNTIAILAAALIPMAGMVGGGVDISRMYILKTRLQHGCDAGALAGRRAMGGGTWSYNSNYANTQALKFFDANFEAGSFDSSALTRTFTESAGKVTGNAQATIPMTLMKIFGRTTETIAVTCDAEMRLPNTDVMFVLDTTGSMASIPSGDTVTKIDSLKTSVKCFYEIVARLDTDAACTTGTPSGGTGSQVQIRFGFVPYATNVNVGKLLPTSWFADSWSYQTRKANYTTTSGTTWTQQGNPTVTTNPVSQTNVPSSSCNDAAAAAAGYNSNTDAYSNNNNTKTNTTVDTHVTSWTTANGGTCNGTQTRTVTVYNKTTTTTNAFSNWNYDRLPVTVSLLKNGTSWNDNFQWPIGASGANQTIDWDGCIEERQTTKLSSYDPIPSAAKDLNIDLVPTSDTTTQWAPALPDLVYMRGAYNYWDTGNFSYNAINNTTNDYATVGGSYFCPTPAKKLQSWTDANAFDTYVDTLTPAGNTYHDIGLLWGARLMSPTGLFAAQNAYTSQGGEIERHMIFMTDGDPCTGVTNYNAYGVGWFDRRQTDSSVAPTEGCTTTGTLTAQVNARTAGLCTAIKNKNITLWVITFGYVDPDTVTRMTACATSGKYFSANNAAQLQSTFKSIADQISQLRLTN